MVTKKNSSIFKNNSLNEQNLLNNLQFSFDSNNEEDIKNEVLNLYNTITEEKIELSDEEKNEILHELNLILTHLGYSIENIEKLSNANSKKIDNEKNSDSNLNNHVNFNNTLTKDKSNIEDNSAKNNLSVDDALNDLIDKNVNSVISTENNNKNNSSPKLAPNKKEILESNIKEKKDNNLSVDDALNDLIVDYANEIAIKVENISMSFKVSKDRIDTLKEFVIRTIKRNKSETKIVTALNNVSFEIQKGDRVGIIGFNGAGKSTLLKILAGVYDPTEGTIKTKGKIAPLLELGAGFDPNYTGKDNIFLNGAFLGYSEDFLKNKYDEIVEFSELGESINYHVKSYSSGMRAKLGFSIATIVEPDILILDEILSVGDIRFRKKSADKLKSLINSGITVLIVSHAVAQIRELCNKAIWIDEGKLVMYDEVNKVCDAYVKAASKATKDQIENIQLD